MTTKLAFFAINTADLTRSVRLHSPRDVAVFLLGKRVDHHVIIIQLFVDGQPDKAVSIQLKSSEVLAMEEEVCEGVRSLTSPL